MTTKKTAPAKSGASKPTSQAAQARAVKVAEAKEAAEKAEAEEKEAAEIAAAEQAEKEAAEKAAKEDEEKAAAEEKSKFEAINTIGPPESSGPTVVIPFRANKAKGKELLYAIRAWERHLPNVVIILVGDTLPELSKKVLHIPHKPASDNPQIDVASKMAAAIASDLVPEVFIWSNDDIYCVSDIQDAELLLLKAMPGGLAAKGSAEGIYRENALRTLKALKEGGITKPYDYATHTPVVFEKEKLARTLAAYKCTKEGHLVSSLYFNTWFTNVKPVILDNSGRGSVVASVFRPNPNPQVMPTIFATQKWVNNNDRGWKAVEPYLAKMFPEKSAFEK